MQAHHMSIRTANIHQAITFYQVLGFVISEQFTTGCTLACWLQGPAGRLELIQIPHPHPPPDAFGDEHYVGYYHLSWDLTDELEPNQDLSIWLTQLRQQLSAVEMSLKVLLAPTHQVIGDRTYQVAFIVDTDGLPIELLRDCGPVTA